MSDPGEALPAYGEHRSTWELTPPPPPAPTGPSSTVPAGPDDTATGSAVPPEARHDDAPAIRRIDGPAAPEPAVALTELRWATPAQPLAPTVARPWSVAPRSGPGRPVPVPAVAPPPALTPAPGPALTPAPALSEVATSSSGRASAPVAARPSRPAGRRIRYRVGAWRRTRSLVGLILIGAVLAAILAAALAAAVAGLVVALHHATNT